MDIKNKNKINLTCPPAYLPTCPGFTLLELLIVLVIIGFLVTATGRAFRKVDKDAQITAALSDMKAISEAIVNGMYPDIGYIPYPMDDPLLTTSYLCLDMDYSPEEINKSTYQKRVTYYSRWGLQYKTIDLIDCEKLKEEVKKDRGEEEANRIYATCRLLGKGDDPMKDSIKKWDIYHNKGWRGPYIKCNGSYYYKPKTKEGAEEGYSVPIIESPWADRCEQKAREAEKDGDDDLAKEYRKGKYYQILPAMKACTQWFCYRYTLPGHKPGTIGSTGVDCCCLTEKFADMNWAVLKSGACIVSRGPNCLSDGAEEFLKTSLEKSQGKYDCKKLCMETTCKYEINSEYIREAGSACMNKCVPECINEHIAPMFFRYIEKLKISDPSDPDYMDIGDDMVLFVFSGGVRSPLER